MGRMDPRDKIREMQASIRKEQRSLDRDIQSIQLKEKPLQFEIKKYAKSGNMEAAKLIAREIAKSRRSVSRIYAAKAQLNSIILNLNHQAAMVKMSGSFQKSTDIMQHMSSLIKLPELQKGMQSLSKEMMKMGLIEEIINDTIDSTVGDQEDIDLVVDKEVNRILYEITAGKIGNAPQAVADQLPAPGAQASASKKEARLESLSLEEPEEEDMRARLDMLRS